MGLTNYKVGYEPWGPSPLDNIAPPKSMRATEYGFWVAVGILMAAVVVLLVGLVIAAVML